MSDTGRQSLTDKFESAVKPESQKTYTEQAGDSVKGTGDSALSSAQPESQKSATQKVGDTLSSNSNQNTDPSFVDKTKHALGLDHHKK